MLIFYTLPFGDSLLVKQNLWWLSPEFASTEDRLYQRNAFTGQNSILSFCGPYLGPFLVHIGSIFGPGGSGLVTILDDMFGTEGTMDFLKDNFFEVKWILLHKKSFS